MIRNGRYLGKKGQLLGGKNIDNYEENMEYTREKFDGVVGRLFNENEVAKEKVDDVAHVSGKKQVEDNTSKGENMEGIHAKWPTGMDTKANDKFCPGFTIVDVEKKN